MLVRFISKTISKPVVACFAAQGPLSSSSVISARFSSIREVDADRPIHEIANSIDTTLTPEQKVYVDKLKKKLRGGVNSPRSIHREVPRPDEVVGLGNFMPRMADNAEALIDYALSHIPPRDGKRGSRRKKRMERKHESKRKYDAIAKKQKIEANLRHQAKLKRIRAEVKAVRDEVQRIAEIQRMKADVRRASAVAKAASGGNNK